MRRGPGTSDARTRAAVLPPGSRKRARQRGPGKAQPQKSGSFARLLAILNPRDHGPGRDSGGDTRERAPSHARPVQPLFPLPTGRPSNQRARLALPPFPPPFLLTKTRTQASRTSVVIFARRNIFRSRSSFYFLFCFAFFARDFSAVSFYAGCTVQSVRAIYICARRRRA